MHAAQRLIALVRALADGTAHGVFEPPLYERANGQGTGIGGDAPLCVGQSPCQFLGGLCTGLRIEGPALLARGRFDGVAGHIQPALLVETNASLTVASLLRHGLGLPLHEFPRLHSQDTRNLADGTGAGLRIAVLQA